MNGEVLRILLKILEMVRIFSGLMGKRETLGTIGPGGIGLLGER